MQTLQTLKQEEVTILIVHHDLSKGPAYFDQVPPPSPQADLFLKNRGNLTKENLHAAYGRTLYRRWRRTITEFYRWDYSNSTLTMP